jgi:alkylation response protein AidB-like acyl-CoA dehydrogenase
MLVPMRQPGVQVRPIEQIDGSTEFNEVFFDDARCPAGNVVGGVNHGWKVAMTTLGFERGTSATTSHRRFELELDAIVDVARANGRLDDPVVRQRLAEAYTKVQVMRFNGLRSLTASLTGKRDPGVAALSATNKMFWSEYHRDAMELWTHVAGLQSLILDGVYDPTSPNPSRRRGKDTYRVNAMQASFFFSRSETIWGGSAEIQRNIVGERVLGLPKEPRPEPR